jgi:hypothetical protein
MMPTFYNLQYRYVEQIKTHTKEKNNLNQFNIPKIHVWCVALLSKVFKSTLLQSTQLYMGSQKEEMDCMIPRVLR